MKNRYIIVLFLVITSIFNACKKENKISKALEGKWTFIEYKTKNAVYTDFSAGARTLEFFENKKAYTKTMRGIYRFDYTNPSKLPIIDTFEYQLKGEEIDITKILLNKRTNGVYNNTFVFLRRRFKIADYKKNTLTLRRIDSTDLYIKATK